MSQTNTPTWKYSIVLAEFPFADDTTQTKPRPALCLTEPIGKYHEIVVAYITSKIPYHKLPTDLILTKDMGGFDSTGLSHKSVIRLHKINTVNAGKITKVFGRITDTFTFYAVERKLRNFFFSDLTKLSEEQQILIMDEEFSNKKLQGLTQEEFEHMFSHWWGEFKYDLREGHDMEDYKTKLVQKRSQEAKEALMNAILDKSENISREIIDEVMSTWWTDYIRPGLKEYLKQKRTEQSQDKQPPSHDLFQD